MACRSARLASTALSSLRVTTFGFDYPDGVDETYPVRLTGNPYPDSKIAAEQVTDTHITSALRARADEALYLAKRLGRDRVVMWAPGIKSNATPPWSDIVASLK